MSSVEDDSLEGGAETIVQVQVKDLRIDNSVHDGRVFEEDSDVGDGVAERLDVLLQRFQTSAWKQRLGVVRFGAAVQTERCAQRARRARSKALGSEALISKASDRLRSMVLGWDTL
jgi:hypothetical protein